MLSSIKFSTDALYLIGVTALILAAKVNLISKLKSSVDGRDLGLLIQFLANFDDEPTKYARIQGPRIIRFTNNEVRVCHLAVPQLENTFANSN